MPTGVLLVNLGSPKSCATADVRRFLRRFLSDQRVIEAPRWLWFLVLNLLILPRRPQKSAAAYSKIWQQDGSPLVVLSQRLGEKLGAALKAHNIHVGVAMRYSAPEIDAVMQQLRAAGCERVILLPLYPQYSATTSATIVDALNQTLSKMRNQPEMRYIKDFYQQDFYINALAEHIGSFWQQYGRAQKMLFSFHGLPQSYVAKGDPYQQQCETTAALLAQKLNLSADEWQMSFQSRFGRQEWLQPYTDATLMQLGREKCPSLTVFCPGFSVDCLETLEEIAITGKAQFQQNGGGDFAYISALNDSDIHVKMLRTLIERHLWQA